MWMFVTLIYTPLFCYTELVLQGVCFLKKKNMHPTVEKETHKTLPRGMQGWTLKGIYLVPKWPRKCCVSCAILRQEYNLLGTADRKKEQITYVIKTVKEYNMGTWMSASWYWWERRVNSFVQPYFLHSTCWWLHMLCVCLLTHRLFCFLILLPLSP